MKTTLIIGAVAMMSLMSCKKDYNCQCTITTTEPAFEYAGMSVPESTSTIESAPFTINDKEDDAKSECAKGSTSTSMPSEYSSFGQEPTTMKTVCAIK